MGVKVWGYDYTILASETRAGQQKAVDSLYDYCHKWKLDVNSQKTEVIIFGRDKLTATDVFGHGVEVLDIVDRFKYLGVKFSKLGNFAKTRRIPVIKLQKQ